MMVSFKNQAAEDIFNGKNKKMPESLALSHYGGCQLEN
jgi:addiction module HigA family antidote